MSAQAAENRKVALEAASRIMAETQRSAPNLPREATLETLNMAAEFANWIALGVHSP